MGFYPVAVYYSKTHHTNNTPGSNNHSTQNDANNKGHTTHNENHTIHNEYNYNYNKYNYVSFVFVSLLCFEFYYFKSLLIKVEN
jgi:hypothetical protein